MLGKLQRPAMGMTRLFSTLVKKPKLELTMRTPYRTIFNNFTEFTRVYVNSLEGQIAIGTRSTSRVYLLPPGGVTVKNMQPGDGNLSESQSGEFVHGGGWLFVHPDNSMEIDLVSCEERESFQFEKVAPEDLPEEDTTTLQGRTASELA